MENESIYLQREWMTAIFDHTPIGMAIVDKDAVIKKANKAFLSLLNLDTGNLIDQHLGDGIKCANSLEEGCGKGTKCTSCKLTNKIREVVLSGAPCNNLTIQQALLQRGRKIHLWYKVNFTPVVMAGVRYILIVLDDITKQKEKEEQLIEAKTLAQKMMENFPTMIWRTDTEKNCNYLNKTWLDFTGTEKEESLGNGWLNTFHPDDRERCRKIFVDAWDKGIPFEMEHRMRSHKGEYHFVVSIGTPYYDFEEKFSGYIGTVYDVTNEKNAQENLMRYQILLKKARDIILFIDREGKIIEANEAARKAYGYTKQELLTITENELQRFPAGMRTEKSDRSNDEGVFFETVHYHKDGTPIPVEISLQGTIIGEKEILIYIIRDISERKKTEKILRESEEKFRNLFHNATDTIFLHEVPKGEKYTSNFIEVNEAACKRLKYRREELLGLSPEDIITEKMQMKRFEIYEKLLAQGHYIFESVHKAKDGKEIPVEVSAHCFDFEGKKFIISICRDMTERKHAADALIKARDTAEAANRAKSEFLANMSHEIRTPINGIVGMIDLVLLTGLTYDQKEKLLTAKSCANSLVKIINDILDFSKMEAGKLSIDHTHFEIKNLIEEIIKSYTPIADKKGLELSYSFSSSIPQYLLGDPNRLRQVLNNLIGNAIKFTEKGEVSISIKKNKLSEGEVELKFVISDTGIGISETEQKRLFKTFTQVDSSITRRFGGTGLGLVISRQLIEMMGGEIWLKSEKGKGSTFFFTIKFMPGKANAERPFIRPVVIRTQYARTILLAEDDVVNQKVITCMLKEKGYFVDIANNGLEVLKLYKKKNYDVILMDIQMPKMDGIEATKRIRQLEDDKKSVPIIALTAYALQGDRERFIELGMDEYLSKPIQMEELVDTIEKTAAGGIKNDMQSIGVRFNENGEVYFVREQNKKIDENNIHRLEHIQDKIKELQQLAEQSDLDEIEKKSSEIKELANQLEADALKSRAFKIQLAARRENFKEVIEAIGQMKNEYETLKKSI